MNVIMGLPDRRKILVGLALLLAGVGVAWSDEDDAADHERARQALEEGEARPLIEILENVRDRLGGDVIDVDFEREPEGWVYKFKVINSRGEVHEISVDAKSNEIITQPSDIEED